MKNVQVNQKSSSKSVGNAKIASKIRQKTKNDEDVTKIAKITKQSLQREALKEASNATVKVKRSATYEPYIAPEFKADGNEKTKILKKTAEPMVVEQKKKVEKQTKKETPVKKDKVPSLVDVLTPFIAQGKFTKKELVTIGKEKLPHLSDSTIATILTDCKNPKYNKFTALVEVTEKGIYKFKKA